MAPNNLEHRQTHNLLLISKLLNQRESASPFTLVLDSLEQSARPLIADCMQRARKADTRVIFVSIDTLRRPAGADIFIPLWRYGLDQSHSKLAAALEQQPQNQRCLIIIDSLNALCSGESTSSNLPALLSSFLRPNVSLIATYHTDIPAAAASVAIAYRPPPLSLLRYLATTIITVHSFHHMLAHKKAREKGIAEPSFGLDQGLDGVVVGEGAQGQDGLVLEMEFRRKSGRGVTEWFFMARSPESVGQVAAGVRAAQKAVGLDTVILLENHPLWRTGEAGSRAGQEDEEHDVTFSIGLTERQRRDREGVVLPYFDAQKGGGEGGRILYNMGVEDDFDDEEDEI
ncbi:hypothetical protein B9Z65_2275 [Elsinoe australis]|uniref:Elongator complex protein 5 n=1 Tax=Elsinoe australis TaxID=40998 RepID=A0A2P7ZAB4_9PEZI|nr:hypothetical protein B9Z65_2275 [Elsinoe australis]